ncbi:MAG: CsxC family protein [Clostridium sp.]|uniref:CsxC family protein n=1 Tax=Clostridium sp. TaxID=1506 RepID=UPI003D6D69BB
MAQCNDSQIAACSLERQACATVTTQAESITEQMDVDPCVIKCGPVVVKIPVVIAETNITIPVEATITLDQTVMEVKRIKKNVFLTQSRLIPFSHDSRNCTGILFIAGFIRKNIEYATQTCPSGVNVNVCGDIRHCTVQVPFNFTTRVTFLRPPIFTENTTPSELEFFTDKLAGCDACADPVLGRNPCDQNFYFTEYFNEKPFVELVRADITEIDIHTNPTSNCQTPTEQRFTELTEKIVVNLTLKVLQNQQVRITAL